MQKEEGNEVMEIKHVHPHRGFWRKFKNQVEIQCQPLYLHRFIMFLNLVICFYLNDCLMFQYPQKMGITNIYVVMTSYGICSIVGVAVVSFYSHRMKRRPLNFICCLFLTVLSFSLLFFRNYSENKSLGMVVFGLTCLMRMATDIGFCLLFTYSAELFPTKIRAFTSGIVVYLG